MYTKYSKIVLVWAIAFFSSLAAFGNLSDYDSNYELVRHVLKMDTTFPDNKGMWRAIDSPLIHHAVIVKLVVA